MTTMRDFIEDTGNTVIPRIKHVLIDLEANFKKNYLKLITYCEQLL